MRGIAKDALDGAEGMPVEGGCVDEVVVGDRVDVLTSPPLTGLVRRAGFYF